jgi:hypothetical protein
VIAPRPTTVPMMSSTHWFIKVLLLLLLELHEKTISELCICQRRNLSSYIQLVSLLQENGFRGCREQGGTVGMSGLP